MCLRFILIYHIVYKFIHKKKIVFLFFRQLCTISFIKYLLKKNKKLNSTKQLFLLIINSFGHCCIKLLFFLFQSDQFAIIVSYI